MMYYLDRMLTWKRHIDAKIHKAKTRLQSTHQQRNYKAYLGVWYSTVG